MERVAAATAASPHAATAAKTPSADTATQMAAGASTRNGAARRATSSAPSSRRVTRTATGVVQPSTVRVRAQAKAPPRPTATSPTYTRSAPGGWPATCVGQLPVTPTGIRSTNPRRRPGTSWTWRAVRRYSLWFSISCVSPARPSTYASPRVHASVATYVVGRSAGHERRRATAGAHTMPSTPTATATAVPGPTRGSTQPASGAKGRTGCRLARTRQCHSGGTTTAATMRSIATARPPRAARSVRSAGTRTG